MVNRERKQLGRIHRYIYMGGVALFSGTWNDRDINVEAEEPEGETVWDNCPPDLMET